ncbi:IucA/IucC family protein [Shinella sp.]|uniref:IucA/IucC family protein n=1 Tax=Shinella sp. TaxID=1870904 RepID=UPI003F711D07
MPLPLENPAAPRDRVLRQLVAALIFERLVTIEDAGGRLTWQLVGRDYRCRGHIGPFGRPRIAPASVEMRGDDGAWMPAAMALLLGALPGPERNRQKLLSELELTVSFATWNRANIAARDRRSLSFAGIEAALDEGHPYHPCYKARAGFSFGDNRAYGPEAAQPFQLLWLLVARKHLRHALPTAEDAFWHRELGEETFRDLQTRRTALGLSQEGFGLVPIHPWQWQHLKDDRLAEWLSNGDVHMLGPAGDRYLASQSIRSLHNLDAPHRASVKLSLGIVNTSSRRILTPHSVCTAPVISDWIGRVVEGDPLFAERYPLTILKEYAGLIADRHGPLAGEIATIWRDSAEATLAPGEAIVPFNALAVIEVDGTPFIAPWLARYGLSAWFERLVEVAVLPVWHLLVCHGIAVEAHAQNMLLVHRDGWPVRLILRDFHESMEYARHFLREPHLEPDFPAMDAEYATAEPDDFYWTEQLDMLRMLVTDTLFVHNLTDLTHLIDTAFGTPEAALWDKIGRRLETYAAEHGLSARQARLGHAAASIRAESLVTRKLFAAAPEYHHDIPNPFAPARARKGDLMLQIDDRTYERRAFETLVDAMAEAAGLDREPIGRLAVCFPETADWLALFFAIRARGGSVLPIHPGTPHAAALKLAQNAGCDRLYYNSAMPERLADTVTSEGQLLQMSSGTTGAPKCIARSWAEIDAEVETYVRAFREPENMTPVVACPTTHSYGLICGILVALKRGQAPVIVNTANPKYLLRRLRETERPLLYSSPAILHTLARLTPEGEKMHALMTSGTLLPDAWFTAIRSKTTHMFQQYGCSESGCIAINPDLTAGGDMGYVLPHLALETGTGIDAPGEIVVAGGGKRVETRDLGYRRADGMLVFISRLDDMINVSGLNVYPKDVEDAVMVMPDVTDAVAFRREDRFAGERVGLLFSASEIVAPNAVRAWCAERLAGHQLPTEILQVPAVPRQANGKISRRDVAARFAAGEFTPNKEAAE